MSAGVGVIPEQIEVCPKTNKIKQKLIGDLFFKNMKIMYFLKHWIKHNELLSFKLLQIGILDELTTCIFGHTKYFPSIDILNFVLTYLERVQFLLVFFCPSALHYMLMSLHQHF